MQRSKWICSTAVGAVLGCAAFATSASAQSAPPAVRSTQIEEVVVTARRQAENLQTTPVSVTAVPAGELQARGVENISDVSHFTPNMTVGPAIATKNTARITLRGQVQNDGLITTDPSS